MDIEEWRFVKRFVGSRAREVIERVVKWPALVIVSVVAPPLAVHALKRSHLNERWWTRRFAWLAGSSHRYYEGTPRVAWRLGLVIPAYVLGGAYLVKHEIPHQGLVALAGVLFACAALASFTDVAFCWLGSTCARYKGMKGRMKELRDGLEELRRHRCPHCHAWNSYYYWVTDRSEVAQSGYRLGDTGYYSEQGHFACSSCRIEESV